MRWRSACACASTHTGCDECHLCAVIEHVGDGVEGLLGCLARTLGFVTSSESFLAQLQMDRDGGVVECLIVCITEYERHVVDAFTIHVIDGITTTATYSDDFDYTVLLLGSSEI